MIAITITDYIRFPALDDLLNKFKLRAALDEVYTDDLELFFAESSKFTKSAAEVETLLDRLYYFLLANKCSIL